jgi:hypothetical protein
MISGTTTTRGWLEQKLPDLLDYRLSDFRVYTVVRAPPSLIPLNVESLIALLRSKGLVQAEGS